MNSVQRVKQLCKDKKIPIYKLEKDLGYANGYIGQLKKGVFPDDRLKEIANYLDVSTSYLIHGAENEDAPIDVADEIQKLINYLTDDRSSYCYGEVMSEEGKLALLNSLKQDKEFLAALYKKEKK